jgi:hypothetical protein
MKWKMKQENLMLWKSEVMGMDFVSFGDSADGITNTYDRFVTHIQEVTRKILLHKDTQYDNMRNEVNAFQKRVFIDNIPDNWWDVAKRVGEGKYVLDNPILNFAEINTESDKEAVYDVFIPMYRAVKENFDKRIKLFSWIFDHARYTAERDTLKALSGLMQSLTGDGQRQIDGRLSIFQKQVTLSDAVEKSIKACVDDDRKEYKKALKSGKRNEEDLINDDLVGENLIDNAEVNENNADANRYSIKIDSAKDEKSIMIESRIEESDTERTFDSLSSGI